jgi:hypothetical protein
MDTKDLRPEYSWRQKEMHARTEPYIIYALSRKDLASAPKSNLLPIFSLNVPDIECRRHL